MYYSDDPVRDAERHMEDQDRQLERLPVCATCDEPIQDDYYFLINDEVMCKDCLIRDYRKNTEDYV